MNDSMNRELTVAQTNKIGLYDLEEVHFCVRSNMSSDPPTSTHTN